MAVEYKDSFWGPSLDGFDTALFNARRACGSFRDLAESLHNSRVGLEEQSKGTQRVLREHVSKDAGVNAPLFDAALVASEKQVAAMNICAEKLRGIEEKARNDEARRQLEAFTRVAGAPQLANTVRLALRKIQQSEKKGRNEDKAARAEKLRKDTERFQERHAKDIAQLELFDRASAEQMRALLADAVAVQREYHARCCDALDELGHHVDELDVPILMSRLVAAIGTGTEKPVDLLESGMLGGPSLQRRASTASQSSGSSMFGTLRRKGEMLRKKTKDSLQNTSQSSMRSRASSTRSTPRGSTVSQGSVLSGAASAVAAAGAAAGWAAETSEHDANQVEGMKLPAKADSSDESGGEEERKPKIRVKIRPTDEQPPLQEADSLVRLSIEPAQTRRRPQSPTADRRRVRPVSSDGSAGDEFNPRGPRSPMSTVRSPLSFGTLSQSGSSNFGTFRPGGLAMPGLQVAVTETCHAYFKGPSLGKAMVQGKVMVAFDRGLVDDLRADGKPFALRLTNASRLARVTPHPSLLPQATPVDGRDVADGELVYELGAEALEACFTLQLADVTVSGEQARATLLTYAVTAESLLALAPLRVCATWRCGDAVTDVTLDYMHNQQAMDKTLTDIAAVVDMQGLGVTNAQSQPTGKWMNDKMTWSLPANAGARGKLRARFDVASRTHQPTRAMWRFGAMGTTLSGVDIASATDRGSCLNIVRTIKRVMSGMYIADYIEAPFLDRPMTPMTASTPSLVASSDVVPLSSPALRPFVSEPSISTAVAAEVAAAPAEASIAEEAASSESLTGATEPVADESVATASVADHREPVQSLSTDAHPSNLEYNHSLEIQLQVDEIEHEVETGAPAVNSESESRAAQDDESLGDNGKGPADEDSEDEPLAPTVPVSAPDGEGHDDDRRPSTTSTSSTAGLPGYEVVTSTPAPILDFDEFLRMTKPSPRTFRRN